MVVGLACLGCWEEIRYQTPTAPSDANPRPAKAASTTAAEEVPQAPHQTSEAETAVEPSAEDLFGINGTIADDISAPPADAAGASPAAEDHVEVAVPGAQPDGEQPEIDAVSPAERLDAWTMVNSWSLAAAVHAKGLDASRYQTYWDEASRAATMLELELPPLPTADADGGLEASVVRALQSGTGAELVATIAERLDATAGGAAQLAIDAHLVLLVYSPASDEAAALAAAVRAAGAASQLPDSLWQPLADLIERRADYADVRAAVFALRKDIADHLSRSANP